MEIKSFFFDTYAFHEIIDGNPKYKAYLRGIAAITTRLNLMELYYGLLLKYGLKTAEKYYDLFLGHALPISDETIKLAMQFKIKNKKRDLSYVDCIGYIMARQKGVRFLTGDKEFYDLENVEFVK